MTMGTLGLGLFLSLLGMYAYYQRRQSTSNGGGGGGGTGGWKDGRAIGANIKGVGDLPKAPKGG